MPDDGWVIQLLDVEVSRAFCGDKLLGSRLADVIPEHVFIVEDTNLATSGRLPLCRMNLD